MDYQNEYIALHPDLHCGEAELKSKKILEVLSPNLRIDSILDVACGSGKILLNLSERLRSNRSVGVDISNKVIDVARKNDSLQRVSWIVSDVFDLKERDFDL